MSRPEAQGPPEYFYGNAESRKYTQNSRIIKVQGEMSQRALELLALPADGRQRLILDLGCGSGLSGAVIGAAGHCWIGMDISEDMLGVARERLDQQQQEESSEQPSDMELDDGKAREMGASEEDYDQDGSDYQLDSDDDDGEAPFDAQKCIDLFHADMGHGACFRPGTFDGCISISALQWLCHSNRSCERPRARLTRLFTTLFGSLARGARAVFQFYPESSSQIDLILGCAMKAGFTGGLVVDFPNSTRAKKYYLCLMTGPAATLPQGLDDSAMSRQQRGGEEDAATQVAVDRRTSQSKWARKKANKGPQRRVRDKGWVMRKKEVARQRGQVVKNDSKYTARKRRIKF